MTAPRLLHLGNVVVDVIVKVPHLPVSGGDVLASAGLVTPGGGFNVMAAARRHGLETVYGGMLGSGPFANMARRALRKEGISWTQTRRVRMDTGFVVCLIEPSGERSFATYPGAEATLELQQLKTLSVTATDLVYVSGYSLLYESNRQSLLQWLPNLPDETRVIYDPGPLATDVPNSAQRYMLSRADWLSCNAREACALTDSASANDAAQCLTQLTQRGQVVVRDGPSGCIIAERDSPTVLVPGIKLETVVDQTGAGDAFTGAFLAVLAHTHDPHEAGVWANATAALSVTRLGPATAPTRFEVHQWLLERQKHR